MSRTGEPTGDERAELRELRERVSRLEGAERALRESEARLRQIIDLVPHFIFAKDVDGRFLLVNEALAEVYGTTVEELIGKTDADFAQSEEEVKHFRRDDLAVIESGRRKLIPEEPITDSQGSVRYLQTIKIPYTTAGTDSPAILGVATDITARKQAEDALHEREEQLRQAQKMEAIGQLAGGVAHDLNNILTVIIGNAQWILEDLGETDRLRPEASEILGAAERAASLTRQLLAFSRRSVMSPRILDLNAVVAGTEQMLRRLIGEHIVLRTELMSDVARVEADPTQLEQVVLNLTVNARDAMRSGGELVMSTAEVRLGDEADIGVPFEPGDYVRLSVSDTGTGMDAETRRRVFEPFFTTKERGHGTGLGLSTVYGIIKQSGGYVTVRSEVDAGTSIDIYLPRVTGELAPEVVREASGAPGGDETVLLVEDEEGLRRLSRRVLETSGYTVLEAENAARALEICEEHGGQVDLLVTDVVMPGMGGDQLADRLTEMHPRLKVLFISGYPDSARRSVSPSRTSRTLLPKPFSPWELARRVREVLDA